MNRNVIKKKCILPYQALLFPLSFKKQTERSCGKFHNPNPQKIPPIKAQAKQEPLPKYELYYYYCPVPHLAFFPNTRQKPKNKFSRQLAQLSR